MSAGYETDNVSRLETNLDDLSPEITGFIMGKLFDAGALDVYLTPIQMKKNRPGTMLSVLCDPVRVEALSDIIFAQTSAFGLRVETIRRLKLERRIANVMTPFGEVTVKLGLKNGTLLQVSPEYESCRAISEASGQPLRRIYEMATESFRQRQA